MRHGLAQCNLDGVIGGKNGCRGLTPSGRSQIELLANRVLIEARAGRKVMEIVASPRRRTVESAQLLAERLGLPVRIDPHFCDQEFGPELDGTKWSDLRRILGLSSDEFPSVRMHPGAETWQEHLDRVACGLAPLLESASQGRVIVVAHTETVVGAYRAITQEVVQQSRVAMRHAAMTVWRVEASGWSLDRHDDVRHLEG